MTNGDGDENKDEGRPAGDGAAGKGSEKTSPSGHPPDDPNWDYELDKPRDQNAGD